MDRNIRVTVTERELALLGDRPNKDEVLKLFMKTFITTNESKMVKTSDNRITKRRIVVYDFEHNGIKFSLEIATPLDAIDEGMVGLND